MLTVLPGAALAQPAPVRTFEITVAGGQVSVAGMTPPARGAPTLRVRQGEAVELRWQSDAAMALHFHGYKIEASMNPGQETKLAFTARATGRFAVETHDTGGRHRTLLYVEVHPR